MNPLTNQQLPNPPTTIPIGSVANGVSPLLTPIQTGLPNADVHNALSGLITGANATATASQKAVDTGLSDVQILSNQLGGQTADQQSLEAGAGLPAMNKDLSDLNTLQQQQLGSYISSYNQAEAARNTRQETTVAQQNLQRQHGVDALLTSSLIAAKSGNIQTAQANVDRALALKYDPIKQALQTKQYVIDQLKGKATTDAKNSLDLQMKQLDDQMNNEKTKQNLIIEASGQGVPGSLLSQAQQASTPQEAAQILGILPNSALEMQAKIQSIAASKASVAKIYADIAADNAKNGAKNFVTPPIINPQTGKLDPATQLATVIAGSGTKDNANLQAIGGVVSAIQQFAENNQDGSFPGIGWSRAVGPFVGPKGTENLTSINGINLKLQQWASGASLTDQQTKQVEKMAPNAKDTQKIVREKTNALTNFMLSQAQGLLTTQGIKYTPSQVDFFGDKGLNSLSNSALLNTIPSNFGSPTVSNQEFFK